MNPSAQEAKNGPDRCAERIEAALLDQMAHRQLLAAAASGLVAVMLFLALLRPGGVAVPAVWLAAALAVSVFRAWIWRRRKAAGPGNALRAVLARDLRLAPFLVGVCWSTPIFMADPGDAFMQTAVVCAVAGIIAGAVTTFAGDLKSMAPITLGPLGALLWWFASNVSPPPLANMGMFVVFVLFIAYVSLDTNRRAREALRLGFENLELVEELRASERQVREMANRDELTGLPNRRLLAEFFIRAKSEARRHGFKLAVLFVDLDDFKPVNDRFGHKTGDEVLRQVSLAMSGALRDVDILARVGGDEFVAVVEGVTGQEDTSAVSARLAASLGGPIRALGHDVCVGASIGEAVYPDDAATLEELMALADSRMYSRKAAASCALDSGAKAR